MTNTVEDVGIYYEAQSYHGISVVKVFLQPKANLYGDIAEVSSVSTSAILAACLRAPPRLSCFLTMLQTVFHFADRTE